MRELISTLTKKMQVGNESLNIPPKSSQARKKPPSPPQGNSKSILKSFGLLIKEISSPRFQADWHGFEILFFGKAYMPNSIHRQGATNFKAWGSDLRGKAIVQKYQLSICSPKLNVNTFSQRSCVKLGNAEEDRRWRMLCNLSPVSDKAVNDVSGMNINNENCVVLGSVIFGQRGAHLHTNWQRDHKSLFG